MANDAFVDQKINESQEVIKSAVLENKPQELNIALRFFAKEIERETRHKAASLAQELSKQIHNL